MSLHPNDKRSFKIFKKIKTPSASPFIPRKDKSGDKASLKSAEFDSTKSPETETAEKSSELTRSIKSPKTKSGSLRKLFKKPSYSKRSKLNSSSEVGDIDGQVSFSNIMCSTPLINPETTPDSKTSIESVLDSSIYREKVGTKPAAINIDPEKKKDPADRSDESGIFSPSFSDERFTPPPGEEPFTPPSQVKQQDVPEYTPPTAFKSGVRRNGGAGHDQVVKENGEGEKAFSRLKIPAIELTKPNKQGSKDSLAADPSYIIADNKSVKSMDSMKDEEFVSSPLTGKANKSKSTSKSDPYRVELTVISSSNLASRDSNGVGSPMPWSNAADRLSDPYCKIKVGLQRARTKVCPKNLNPQWEEKFSFVVESLDETIRFKVMDYDRGFRDDLIGYYEMKLSFFPLDDFQTFTEELIDDNGTEDLGSIKFSIHISADLSHTPPPDMDDRETPRSTSPFHEKHLTGILSITLVEACNLRPMNKDGSSDPYCKFKLGHQKHKSKVLRRTLDPVWKERFEIRVYSDSSSILEISVYDYEEFGFSDNFIGSAEVDISEFEESKTYKRELDLEKNGGRMICIFNLSRIDESSTDSSCEISPDDLVNIRKTYAMSYNPLNYLTYKWEDVEDVGVLIVKIIKCIDLPEADTLIGSSDPFCFIEVENTRVRTPTLYKTQDPVWNKQFKFHIKDIHSTLNIRVFDEEKNKYNFLGCVKLPILEAHTIHRCLLKDRKLERVGFGEIFLETELIYNPLRAAIKTLLPAEENLLYEEPKFKRNLFMQNFKRVYSLATVVLSLGLWVQRIYNWENRAKSAIALLLYIIIVVSFELYMVPMFAAIVIIYEFLARWVGFKSFETWIMNADLQDQVSKEDEIEDGEDFSLTAKMKMVMGVCQTVQNSLDLVASYCERVKNVFNWTIPFLSFMAASVLISGTIILYFLPLRWLVLAWGINKLTVKLRNPEYEENQELLNFLCRLPSDIELNQMRVITKESSKRSTALNKTVKSRWHK
ncbi:hypothetical protein ACHWQZ_G009618 [Mnemiopsis leidyi]